MMQRFLIILGLIVLISTSIKSDCNSYDCETKCNLRKSRCLGDCIIKYKSTDPKRIDCNKDCYDRSFDCIEDCRQFCD